MKFSQPKVSVIMTVFNAQKYLTRSIESILSQTYKDFELIIVDDGSGDKSLDIAKSYALKDERIKILSRANMGVADSFNDALQVSKGEYITRCDSDDLLPQGAFSWQIDFLNSHDSFHAVCGQFAVIGSRGGYMQELDFKNTSEDITDELKSGLTRTHYNTFMVRRGCFSKVGGFRGYFRNLTEDVDMQLRLSEHFNIWYEARLAYYYRIHGQSVTHNSPDDLRDFFYKRAIEFQKQRLRRGNDDLDLGCAPPVIERSLLKSDIASSHFCGLLTGGAWREHKNDNRFKAVQIGLRVCWHQPFKLASWKNLVALAIKPSLKKMERSPA